MCCSKTSSKLPASILRFCLLPVLASLAVSAVTHAVYQAPDARLSFSCFGLVHARCQTGEYRVHVSRRVIAPHGTSVRDTGSESQRNR